MKYTPFFLHKEDAENALMAYKPQLINRILQNKNPDLYPIKIIDLIVKAEFHKRFFVRSKISQYILTAIVFEGNKKGEIDLKRLQEEYVNP